MAIMTTESYTCPHVVLTDALVSAAFHAYGKPGKTVVELRQVLYILIHIILYLKCKLWLDPPHIIIINV